MQTNTVANTEMKPTSTGGMQTIVHFTDGSKSSGFEPGLQSLTPGDVFAWEPEVKGKYINIKPGAWEVTGHTEVAPVSAPKQQGKDDMSKDDWNEKDRRTRISIERQSCLKAAVEFHDGFDIDHARLINTAELFYQWVSIGKLPGDTVTAPETPPPVATGKSGGEQAVSEATGQKSDSSEDVAKNLGELKTWAKKTFGIIQEKVLLEAAEVKSVMDITDYGEAQKTIKRNREIKPTPQED